MRNTTNQAFSEVYDVINHMSKEMQENIPKSFINLIKDNRDLEYTFNIDYTIDIKKQLLKESKVILSLVYRDYLCSKEKREELLALVHIVKQHYYIAIPFVIIVGGGIYYYLHKVTQKVEKKMIG